MPRPPDGSRGGAAIRLLVVLACSLVLPLAQLAGAQERPFLNAADFGGIQAALDALPPAGGTVLVAAGSYAVAEKIRLRSHVELRGEGMERTILTLADGANDHLLSNASLTQGNTGITIRDLGLRGNAANQTEWSFGVRLVNVTDSLVLNVEASDFSKDGFYLGYNRENGVRNVRVSGCRAVGNRRYGLALKHGTDNLVDGCTFEANGLAEEGGALKLGPDAGLDASGNRVIGNRALANHSGFVLLSVEGYNARVADNVLCGNAAEGNLAAGFQDSRGINNRFLGNMASGNGVDFDLGSAVVEDAAQEACALPPLPEALAR